jgi:hypothetical protein
MHSNSISKETRKGIGPLPTHYRSLTSGLLVILALAGYPPSSPAGEKVLSDGELPSSIEPVGHTDNELSYTTGESRYQSDFSEDDLDRAPWAVQHGRWQIRDGVLAGDTTAGANHTASLSLMLQVPENLLVSLDFSLGENESFAVCFIGGSGPHGRIMINPKEGYLWMKAGDTGAARVIDYVPLDLATGTQHHLSFLRHGDRLVATINGEHHISGRHEKFTSPKKRINLTAETAKTQFDNISVVNISEVKASPELFSKPSYSLSEFWAMREEKYGLIREVNAEKEKNP